MFLNAPPTPCDVCCDERLIEEGALEDEGAERFGGIVVGEGGEVKMDGMREEDTR